MHDHVYKDVDNDVRRLISFEERSIGPCLDEIRGGDTDATVMLPVVLHRIGEAAHKELLARIDRKSDADGALVSPLARMRYIRALQDAFDDYSRFPLWLDFVRINHFKGIAAGQAQKMTVHIQINTNGIP